MLAGTSSGETFLINPTTAQVRPAAGTATFPGPFVGLGIVPTLVLDGDPAECVVADGNPGDINGDGLTTLADFAGWAACLTGPGGAIDDANCLQADVDRDGDIDLHDFRELLFAVEGN